MKASKMPHYKIGFIGAGRMATALARGVIASGFAKPAEIGASDPTELTRRQFEHAIEGAQSLTDNGQVAAEADCVVLAVKPQMMTEAVESIARKLNPKTLVVSIAAGVTIVRLAELLPAKTRIVRVMSNTPALIGRGASAFAVGSHATEADRAFVSDLFNGVGFCCEVPEYQLDAVTGLSGSGPAFVFTVIEALADGGVQCGLPLAIANRLATETVAGAAAMVSETGDHPATLRDAVASPGGTTIAGIAALEQHGLRAALMSAVEAATKRSKELGAG